VNTQPLAGSPERNSTLSPTEKARLLRLLVDELIPGGDGWPSASEAGVHGILSLRLFADGTSTLIETLGERLDWQSGALESGDPATRILAVKALEAADPELFDKIYTAAVLAYYETPFVVETIIETGRPYSIRPHATGYPMAPFDTERDTPKHGRSFYIKTDEVTPVDTSHLDLDTIKTARWGIER
jgi:hypothetical protein